MIPLDYITEWRQYAPWTQDFQVEQDLIICRAIVDIFSNPTLKKSLAMRGGTALHKFYLKPPIRYSEDIDLVQTTQENIGHTLDILQKQLNPWLGKPKKDLKTQSVVLKYRFESEESPPIILQIFSI